ncbi:dihydrodipicolinate synthase family protein [Streptosporangium roseum]|uniref:Dihydropicolinate synthase family protein n=1 Tax=Streptosporangium roseum (strain ATCC 12428 / DSM 43021 / JCM 3005 / KCTC 9067 / NCIMB 10171 / NRRL 2505 / NI 9100) TaxID=479432 RepID=D2B2X1_STRRD|nr:dihydrodipicolinate synthase family protein [Streptosporangium roseum]ACZ85451.1 putative dihydropicolinate synthase family protein [Streptosporangium roseum DSM 43021]
MSPREPRFSGVVPPLVTPLTPGGEVDVPSLERLVEFLVEAGVTGLFALGSSGEAAFLTDARRDRALEVVVRTVAGRVPVLAGCIETTTARVIERAEVAAKLGADATVVTAPFYTRIHPLEIDRHFRAVRAAVDLPMFAYDVPVSVHTKLAVDQVLALAADGVIDGLKDSSGDDVGFRQVVLGAAGLPGFSALTGHEVVVDAMMLAGADGAVPGLGNVDPHGYVRLLRACAEGRWADAKAEQDRLTRLFRIVDAASPETAGGSTRGIGAFKTALALRGVIASAAVSQPMRELTADETRAVASHLHEAGLL